MDTYQPIFAPLNSLPSKDDIANTQSLKEYIDTAAPLQTEQEHRKKEALLVNLRELVNVWVKDTCLERGCSEEVANQGGRLFVSGSYRTGISQSGDDIDTICVVPHYVTRDDFFDETNGLFARIKKRNEVTHILPIGGAKVPILEVVWNGFELDVLFASVNVKDLPKKTLPNTTDDLLDDQILKGAIDEGTILSLNGPRVTELLVKLVPSFETFKLVLRCARHWAKQRGIYSNKLGYLGGVNFSILVAFCCRLYPKQTPSRLLALFFHCIATWKWPTPIELCFQHQVEGLEFPQWVREPNARMPIITPAYPCANSSYNVSTKTLEAMLREFSRAAAEANKILESPQRKPEDWGILFTKTDFFVRFKVYLVLEARANSEAELKKWSGWCESRIRKLVDILETRPLLEIVPYPKSFRSVRTVKKTVVNEEEEEEEVLTEVPVVKWYIGIRMNLAIGKPINIMPDIRRFIDEQLLSWTEHEQGMEASLSVLRFKDLVSSHLHLYPNGQDIAIQQHFEANPRKKIGANNAKMDEDQEKKDEVDISKLNESPTDPSSIATTVPASTSNEDQHNNNTSVTKRKTIDDIPYLGSNEMMSDEQQQQHRRRAGQIKRPKLIFS